MIHFLFLNRFFDILEVNQVPEDSTPPEKNYRKKNSGSRVAGSAAVSTPPRPGGRSSISASASSVSSDSDSRYDTVDNDSDDNDNDNDGEPDTLLEEMQGLGRSPIRRMHPASCLRRPIAADSRVTAPVTSPKEVHLAYIRYSLPN